ncbi:Surfeit locus protein 1 [Orchesella cincta]|uniref:SURF1-like protein n=1 Tax=Orchesella cincta TaxID=48709 RepID=A0A1D2M9D1_ORCCI|nr:Surfeit locus protein 1 [Orchesella cincta]
MLVIPVSTLALGIWQVFRWRWKLGLIAEMRRTTLADPVPLPRKIEKLEYRKVQVKGEFDYSNQVLIGPRALVSSEDRTSGRQMSRGVFSSGSTRNGYHIITPFKVEGNGETILVNRGWVESRNFSKYNHVQGSTEIVGIVRKTEQRSPFITKSRPGENLLHFRQDQR